jgi:hypothetical protein
LKPFFEPSSANTGTFSVGESSRARGATNSGRLHTPKLPKLTNKFSETLLRKDGVSKSLIGDLLASTPITANTDEEGGELPHLSDSASPNALQIDFPSMQFEHSSGQSLPTNTSESPMSTDVAAQDLNAHLLNEDSELAIDMDAHSPTKKKNVPSFQANILPSASQKKPGVVRNPVGHRILTAPKQPSTAAETVLPEHGVAIPVRDSSERSPEISEERVPEPKQESASSQVFKATFEKCQTRLAAHVEEEAVIGQKRRDPGKDSSEKDKKNKKKKKKV